MKRIYGIQIRDAMAISRSPNLFLELSLVTSTALQWIHEGYKEALFHPELDQAVETLTTLSTLLKKRARLKRRK